VRRVRFRGVIKRAGGGRRRRRRRWTLQRDRLCKSCAWRFRLFFIFFKRVSTRDRLKRNVASYSWNPYCIERYERRTLPALVYRACAHAFAKYIIDIISAVKLSLIVFPIWTRFDCVYRPRVRHFLLPSHHFFYSNWNECIKSLSSLVRV